MSPALNGSSVVRHFERSDATEIRDGIIFDFYTGVTYCITVIKVHIAIIAELPLRAELIRDTHIQLHDCTKPVSIM